MKWIWRILVGVLVVVAAAAGGGYLWLRGSLPTVVGEVRVAGIAAPVEIVRDRHGVPHIYAQSEADAAFALGYAHAQDRLWQMEMNRRIGAGRLSEMFGERSLIADKFLRVLGVYRVAEANFAKLDAETRAAHQAYADGVNAFLEQRDGPLPPEFVILGHAPEPWRPADSLVWIKMMAFNLSVNWRTELLRARMIRRLTVEQIAEAFPPYPGDAPVALPDLAWLYRGLPLASIQASAPAPPAAPNGSNNWVVSGARTVTGKPLLANDPHLGLAVPSVWYFAHLEVAGRSTIGATLPGVPSIILGRNDRIAWGFTNTGPDVQDLFIEKIDPANPANYLTPTGTAAFETRTEVIRVRGAEPVELVVRATRHGPVISDVIRGAHAILADDRVIAMAWTALGDDDRTSQAGLKMMRAGNWDEFVAAVRDFHVPMQNIVYADADGNIGFYAPARVPVRKPDNLVSGRMPVPGWDSRYDWAGWIPFEELPHAFNPAAGAVITANHKIVPDRYRHHLTHDWEPPYRARRIEQLIGAEDRHSIATFMAIQADVRSTMAEDVLPLLGTAKASGPAAAAALRRLTAWDGTMAAAGIEPTIFVAWMRQLTRLLFADELGDLFPEFWAYRPILVGNVLRNHLGQSRWCDDVTTAAPEDCALMLTRALDLALADLEQRFGGDRDGWRWDRVHAARSDHRPFSKMPVLRRLFELEVPFAGGQYTINRAGNRIASETEPFATVHGPSFRAIYDLDDLDNSLYMHSTGQSGNPLSPLYASFSEPWADVEYIAMTTRRADIEAGALGTLVLRPAP